VLVRRLRTQHLFLHLRYVDKWQTMMGTARGCDRLQSNIPAPGFRVEGSGANAVSPAAKLPRRQSPPLPRRCACARMRSSCDCRAAIHLAPAPCDARVGGVAAPCRDQQEWRDQDGLRCCVGFPRAAKRGGEQA
jgi:hypothetical protein